MGFVLVGCEQGVGAAGGWLPDSLAYPTRRAWGPEDNASLNTSQFVFRDRNGNGVYDVGERPAAGIAVRLWRPDGTQVVRRSNIHGFANFTNSLTAGPVDISEPGAYEFEILVPGNWVLTTPQKSQTIRFDAKPGARPGIVADKIPDPVGLRQQLAIRGRVIGTRDAPGIGEDSVKVSALTPSGRFELVPLDDVGRFRIAAEPGRWLIRATWVSSGNNVERTVQIEHAPVHMSTIVLGDSLPAAAPERIAIDFEDVTTSPITKVPNGVGGLKWTDAVVVRNEFYRGEGYVNITQSGEFAAYNSSGYPVAIEREAGFDFHGGYFGVAWPAAHGETLIVRAWRGERLVGSEQYELSALGPFWFAADYRAITRLQLSTSHHWQFVMDDLVVGIWR